MKVFLTSPDLLTGKARRELPVALVRPHAVATDHVNGTDLSAMRRVIYKEHSQARAGGAWQAHTAMVYYRHPDNPHQYFSVRKPTDGAVLVMQHLSALSDTHRFRRAELVDVVNSVAESFPDDKRFRVNFYQGTSAHDDVIFERVDGKLVPVAIANDGSLKEFQSRLVKLVLEAMGYEILGQSLAMMKVKDKRGVISYVSLHENRLRVMAADVDPDAKVDEQTAHFDAQRFLNDYEEEISRISPLHLLALSFVDEIEIISLAEESTILTKKQDDSALESYRALLYLQYAYFYYLQSYILDPSILADFKQLKQNILNGLTIDPVQFPKFRVADETESQSHNSNSQIRDLDLEIRQLSAVTALTECASAIAQVSSTGDDLLSLAHALTERLIAEMRDLR